MGSGQNSLLRIFIFLIVYLIYIYIYIFIYLIKSRRLRLAGLVVRLEEARSVFKILKVNLQERNIWEGLFKMGGQH